MTAEEVEQEYLDVMGSALGSFYYRLRNECVWLHWKWSDYTTLFGSKPERIELLNSAAPAFFKLTQDTMWEDIILHICRLMDSPSIGKKYNLTLLALPQMIDVEAKSEVNRLLVLAEDKSGFARDWRNRHIAHRDLGLVLDKRSAEPLAQASRRSVKEALESIGDVLNAVESRYTGSTVFYDPQFSTQGNALSLLHVLRDGIEARSARRERLISGRPLQDDLAARPDI